MFLPAHKIQNLKLSNGQCHQMWKKTMLAAPEALKVDHFQLAGVLNGTGIFCTAMWETVPAAVTNYYLHQTGSDNLLLLLLGYPHKQIFTDSEGLPWPIVLWRRNSNSVHSTLFPGTLTTKLIQCANQRTNLRIKWGGGGGWGGTYKNQTLIYTNTEFNTRE